MRNTSAIRLTGIHKLNIAIQRIKRKEKKPVLQEFSSHFLFPEPPQPQMQACVIIPLKNEALNIVKTLDALRCQLSSTGKQLPYALYEVLLLANNCTDDTYEVAKEYEQQHPQFQLHIAQIQLDAKDAHIGTARRLLMDEAFRRHTSNGYDGIILSTDGDTEADPYWITHTLHEIEKGCDAVGGRILTKHIAHDGKRYYLQDTAYRYLAARLEAVTDPTDNDSASCHFQCFGASMAVRCSAYYKAGRLPVIPFLEDEAFSRALYRVDARVKKSSMVKVYTSSRLNGRVKVGLSAHLKHLKTMQEECVQQYVESASTLLQKWRLKRQFREYWHQRKEKKALTHCLNTIGTLISIPPKWLLAEIDISLYFGEFWEKVEHRMYTGKWKEQQQAVTINKAIEELRLYLK